jgi:hypothetical protein
MVQLYARSGGESVVNTATQSFQGVPKITRLNGGGYVIVWSDLSQTGADTSNYAVKAQIYDANGLKVGGEFQVNTTSTSGAQMVDSVAATPNGGFVAVFKTTNEQFKAQRFDSSGAPLGSELTVTAFNVNHRNFESSVTVLTNGTMIVTWAKMDFISGPNYGQHIYAKAFNVATGAQLSGEFRIDSSGDTGAFQGTPSVTALASGGWVATWGNSVGNDTDIVGQVFAANGAKVGGEFTVNTTTAGQQLTPVVTALDGGGFAIAWTDGIFYYSAPGPLPESSIKAQVFTDAGVKVGGEIVVNSADVGPQGVPSIDDLPGGGFVITWTDQSFSGADRDAHAIMARVFDGSGAPVGGQFLVNTVTQGAQDVPVVAGLASGGFAVAWQGPGLTTDVASQLFVPTGAPSDIALSTSVVRETSTGNYPAATLSDNGGVNSGKTYTLLADSTGGAFRIDGDKLVVANNALLDYETAPSASLTIRVTDVNGNSYQEVLGIAIADAAAEDRYSAGAEFTAVTSTPGDQNMPAIGQLASGGYFMAWVDNGGDGSDGSGSAIKAQIFDGAGAKVGTELAVNTSVTGGQILPGVAGLPSGGFVIVWEDSSGLAEAGAGIRGQRFDSAGAKVGGEFSANSITAGNQSAPAVAALASGGFVVTWTDFSNSTPDDLGWGDLRGQVYDSSGIQVGGEFLVNTNTIQGQKDSSVAALPTGGFIVAWSDTYYNNAAVQRFDAAGNKVGGELHVSSFTDSIDPPAIAVLASGGFVVVTAQRDGFDDVRAQVFSADGVALGDGFPVNTETVGSQWNMTVSALPWGGFVIAWTDSSGRGGDPFDSGVRAQMFDSAGARIGEEFVVNTGIENSQSMPVSTVLASGGFVIGWTDTTFGSGSTRSIEGRVFSSVLMDKSGNDILTGDAGANTLDGEGGNDQLYGLGGVDQLIGGTGNDLLDGGTGADSMTGGDGNDVYIVDDAGDSVNEALGGGTDEVRTALALYSLVALPDVENLSAISSSAHDFRGNSGNNVITGGAGADVLRLHDGGDDTVFGGGGNDNIFFIGTLNSADVVNGGDGGDTVVLQGPYGAFTLSANVTEIEGISLLGGGNTAFGEPGTNRYDYSITSNDANFAAGLQVKINGAALLEGEDFIFDGSAETDARFVVYGGRGKDTLTGGQQNDIFFLAEDRFATGDTVNGGPGYDGMFLRGNYTIDFNAPGYTGLFTNIENLTLTSATDERYARGGGTEFDYNVILSNAIVKPGETLTVSGTILKANETMILDASQETDGLLRLFGGKADDTLKGGGQNDLIHGNLGADILAGNGGADSFRYQATEESTTGSVDQILDFTPGADSIDLSRIDANTLAAGDQAFSWIGSGAFSAAAGELRAYEQGGTWFVEGDVNGDGVADLVIALTLQGPTPLSATDFLL